MFELLSKENKNSKCIYFRNKATLKKVTADLENQYFEIVQGYDASNDFFSISIKEVVLPKTFTRIIGYSNRMEKLETIDIPNSVIEIDFRAFYEFPLKEATFEQNSRLEK